MQENSCGRIMDDDGYAPSIFPESEHACFYGNTAQSCVKPETVILYRHG